MLIKFKHSVVFAVAALFLTACETTSSGCTTITVNGVTYRIYYTHYYQGFDTSPIRTDYFVEIDGRQYYCGGDIVMCEDVVEHERRNPGDEGDGGGGGI